MSSHSSNDVNQLTSGDIADICEGLVIPPYQRLYKPTADEEKNYFSMDNLERLREKTETKETSSARKKVKKLLAAEEKSRKKSQKETSISHKQDEHNNAG